MKALITGTSSGIGRASARYFLERGWDVAGIDIAEATLPVGKPERDGMGMYRHFVADVSDEGSLPEMSALVGNDGSCIDVVFANAGVQCSGRDIDVNLKGTINTIEKYAFHAGIRSVLVMASSSAHSGAEFPRYAASKGGLVTYARNVALRLAPYGAVCNSISPGGVATDLNRPVMDDPELWQRIMDLTPLKRWATPEEIAAWVWFLTVENRFCTGQDILIDGGEKDLNSHFVWPGQIME